MFIEGLTGAEVAVIEGGGGMFRIQEECLEYRHHSRSFGELGTPLQYRKKQEA